MICNFEIELQNIKLHMDAVRLRMEVFLLIFIPACLFCSIPSIFRWNERDFESLNLLAYASNTYIHMFADVTVTACNNIFNVSLFRPITLYYTTD